MRHQSPTLTPPGEGLSEAAGGLADRSSAGGARGRHHASGVPSGWRTLACASSYNPGDFNDRLLLGLKGRMSQAELHFLRVRLQGGKLNKARKGQLSQKFAVSQ
jgi:hypothetical protein